jgi:hypothetical protein
VLDRRVDDRHLGIEIGLRLDVLDLDVDEHPRPARVEHVGEEGRSIVGARR